MLRIRAFGRRVMVEELESERDYGTYTKGEKSLKSSADDLCKQFGLRS